MLAALKGNKIKRRLTLYPYQLEGVEKVQEAWEESDRVLGACATGGGKSLLAGELIARRVEKGERCLMLAHQRKLVSQFAQVTERDFGIWSTVEMGGSRSEDSPLVAATVQTMVSRIRKGDIDPEEFKMVVWDEGHHCSSETHMEIAKAFPHAKHIGITATPVASGQRDLMKWFDVKAFDVSLTWLIENGFLCRLENLNIPINIRVDDSDIRAGDFKEEAIGSAIEPYLEGCAEWLATAPEARGRAALIFQPLIRTSKMFVEMLKSRGVKASHVDGTMSDSERESIKKKFEMGEVTVVSNSMLWTEGIDIPCVSLILNLRLTRSWVLYCQLIGRGTRLFSPEQHGPKGTKWGKKESCLIVDPLWICDEINPMRLPNLISADEEEAAAIDAAMKRQAKSAGRSDLLTAANDVKAQKEEALRLRLEANAKRKSRLVDACEFFLKMRTPDFAEYEPLNEYEARPISHLSDKQKAWLEKSKFDMGSIRNMGQARKVLDCLGQRLKENKATLAQVKFAESLGYAEKVGSDPFDATFDQMKQWLDANAPPRQGWTKWRR